MYQDKLPPNVKPNETPIFLKVKERSRYDDELVPTQQEEEYQVQYGFIYHLVRSSWVLLYIHFTQSVKSAPNNINKQLRTITKYLHNR